MLNVRNRLPSEAEQLRVIGESGLFHRSWYLSAYGDFIDNDLDPLVYYIRHGASRGHFPNPLFDTAWYAASHKLGYHAVNALYDYICNGVQWDRAPNALFSPSFYLQRYPDVARHGMDPLSHYLDYGDAELREPSALFSPRKYRGAYTDVPEYANALSHYLHIGRDEGRFTFPLAKEGEQGHWLRSLIGLSKDGAKSVARNRKVRLALFVIGCVFQAILRLRATDVRSSEHNMGIFQFVTTAVRKFAGEGVDYIPATAPLLLTRPYRSDEPSDYAGQATKQPFAALLLYTAQGLKAEGFYIDAEVLLRRLIAQDALAAPAMIELADLYLMHAIWAWEYQSYAQAGTAIDPAELLQLKSGPTWHDRTFGEAIELLENAAARFPYNADILALMVLAYLYAERWEDAVLRARHYDLVRSPNGEGVIWQAQAIFGLNARAGTALLNNAVREVANRLDVRAPYIVECLDQVPSPPLLSLTPTTPATSLDLDYVLIGDGKSMAVKRRIPLAAEALCELADVKLIPEYGAVVAGDQWLLAGVGHMRLRHTPTFVSAIEAMSNGEILYSSARPEPAPVTSACFIGHNNNYYHWLLEDVPRVERLLADPRYAHLPILVDHRITDWQIELLRRVGVSEDRLKRLDFTRPVQIAHLVLPPRLSKNLVVHPQAVSFLRERLVPNHRDLEPKRGKRLYLARQTALVNRGLLNENAIRSRFTRAGFQIVDPGTLSISEQIRLFSDAEIIAAPGGAGLTNMIFAPSRAKILSFSASAILSETFTSLAATLDQQYHLCVGPSFGRAYRYWIWTRFDFTVPITDVDIGLELVLS